MSFIWTSGEGSFCGAKLNNFGALLNMWGYASLKRRGTSYQKRLQLHKHSEVNLKDNHNLSEVLLMEGVLLLCQL